MTTGPGSLPAARLRTHSPPPVRAARWRSFATSESSGGSRIHRQHESQEDRCSSISSISDSSSLPCA